MFGSLCLSYILLHLFSTTSASHQPNPQTRQPHRIRNVRPSEGNWATLQESSIAECAGLRDDQELDGLVLCYKRITGIIEESPIVDQLVVLQYSIDATPVKLSTPLQISWANEARLETSLFTLQATDLSRSIVSHTLHFVHNTTGGNPARPTISIADKSKHLVVLTTSSQTAAIPLNLLSAAIVDHYPSRPTKAALRIQRRQESESLLLAPSTTARRGRPETTETTQMNSEASTVLIMDAPTTDPTRGPRPRTSTDSASTSSPVEDNSVSAQPSHVSFEQEVGYSIHTGREMSEEMIPYGLIAVVTVLGCGCLVVAYSAFSRRALRKEYRQGQLEFAGKQGQF